jgi:hypothetical protein
MAKSEGTSTATEHKIEDFAEDLGRLLGTATGKAEKWLGQRKAIVQHLSDVRDTASKLLTDLGHQAEKVVQRGRPRKEEIHYEPAPKSRKQKRKMSAKARKAIGDAQRRRWALQKAGEKKK